MAKNKSAATPAKRGTGDKGAAPASSGKIKAAIPFDIPVPKLPDRIAEAALTSGGYP